MFFGLPKVHKASILMRPVVLYAAAPAYLRAKFLDHYLRILRRQSRALCNIGIYVPTLIFRSPTVSLR